MSGPNQPGNPPRPLEEQEPNRDVNALFSNFRIDQSSYRTFVRHRNPKAPEPLELVSPEPAEPARRERVHIGVLSPMGGSGKSTFTSSLGGILWRLGKKVLLVDTSPWQVLAFHYGATNVKSGVRSFFAPEAEDLPVRILAWDQENAGKPDIDQYATTHPLDYVLFDLGNVSGKELPAYLQECDIFLVPLLPDPSAVRLAEAMSTLLATHNPGARVLFVVNQMTDISLAKDVRTSLAQVLGDRLSPNPIYRQVEIQQALTEGFVLPIFAPKAQAVTVFNELVRFLEAPKTATTARMQQRWCER